VVRVEVGRRAAGHRLIPNGRLVALGETEVYVHEWGDRSGAPVLYWHGLGGSGLGIDEAACVLTEEYGFRVLAPDMPGFGRSPASAKTPLAAAAVPELAAALLDALSVERCAWIGHSWGAGVGCSVAAALPGRIRALVLLDGGFIDPDDWRWHDGRRLSLADWAEGARAGGIPNPDVWAEAVYASVREYPSSTYATLAASGTPILLVAAGAKKRAVARASRRGIARLRAALPDAKVLVLEEVGHDLPGEAGVEVGRIVGEWLGRYRGSA
jgi:pimeloyl-ACP methyl ester carboxylesterase